MRTMDLHHIESSLPGTNSCGPERCNDLPDIVLGHLLRRHPIDERWDSRWSDGLALAELEETFAATVVELEGGLGASCMDSIRKLLEAGDESVVIGSELCVYQGTRGVD